jgi:predicted glycoside hydrolase/deacetylase ChbG (UPF0249 family)
LTRLLIVNGDDFGLALGINKGIVEAYLGGILTSTSLMVTPEAATDAAEAARAYPRLSVGLHFVGDELHDREGIERSFREQLERFQELLGRQPTHVDSHHHVHDPRMDTFRALVEPLGVPLRGNGQVAYIGGFWGQPDLGCVSRRHLLHLVETEAGEGFTELGCHPGRVSDDLRSTYLDERAVELQTLTEPGLREELESTGVSLVSYQDWYRAAGRA